MSRPLVAEDIFSISKHERKIWCFSELLYEYIKIRNKMTIFADFISRQVHEIREEQPLFLLLHECLSRNQRPCLDIKGAGTK